KNPEERHISSGFLAFAGMTMKHTRSAIYHLSKEVLHLVNFYFSLWYFFLIKLFSILRVTFSDLEQQHYMILLTIF
ncbi:MAG: hypothetical protein KJ588_02050, partial [Gammaproteobacteria bacterium]|nr:hypothetical protein [Gammaproteobacteria bacterium]